MNIYNYSEELSEENIMDCSDGKLYKLTEAQRIAFEKGLVEGESTHLVPISKRQYEELLPLGNTRRKNYMRNQPCVCGSGKKFKKCCWSIYE